MDFTATTTIKRKAIQVLENKIIIDGWVLNAVVAPFSPNLQTNSALLTLATFGGYLARLSNALGIFEYRNNVAGAVEFLGALSSALNGSWVASGAGLPQTVYGVTLVDLSTTETLASMLFPSPILIAANGDGLAVPLIFLDFLDSFMI